MSDMAITPRTETVLVIDDEPESLRMLTAMLETADLTVLIATSGSGAIEVPTEIATKARRAVEAMIAIGDPGRGGE